MTVERFVVTNEIAFYTFWVYRPDNNTNTDSIAVLVGVNWVGRNYDVAPFIVTSIVAPMLNSCSLSVEVSREIV